jgi:hypothetical protein
MSFFPPSRSSSRLVAEVPPTQALTRNPKRIQDLERLVRKYYGYVADLEGSGVEALDLLFVRDKIQSLLDKTTDENDFPTSLFERIYDLDGLLWQERDVFLRVVGAKELQCGSKQHRSPRSHWWWYLDELRVLPQSIWNQRDRLAEAFIPEGERDAGK